MVTTLAPTYFLRKTVAQIFDDMGHEVRKTVKYACKKGLYLEVEAGNQIGLAIERARNAYLDSLDITIEKVDRVFSEQLIKLHGLVEHFEQVVLLGTGQLDIIVQKLRECAITLPLSDKQPQISSFSPQTIIRSSQDSLILFKFQGLFVFASHKNCVPTFKLLGQTFEPSQNLTSELVFQVSSRIFDKITDQDLPFITGTVLIPWIKTKGIIISTETPSEASYNLLFEILPETPGSISLEIITPITKRNVQATSRSYSFSVKRHYEMLARPTPGWTIDGSPARVQFIGGEKYVEKNEFFYHRPDCIYYKVKTKQNKSVQARIDFHEYQDVADRVEKTTQLALKWGESHTVEIPLNSQWKLAYNEYLGVQHKTAMSELKTRFVHIAPAGNALHIQVKNPAKTERDIFPIPRAKL